MLHQVIKFSHGLLPHKSADERHSQAAGNQKSQQGSQGEPYRRVKKSREDPEKISSDEPGNISGDRGKDDLQDLQRNESIGSGEAEGSYKSIDSLSAGEKMNDLSKAFLGLPIIIQH
jgi:hypothetical protein